MQMLTNMFCSPPTGRAGTPHFTEQLVGGHLSCISIFEVFLKYLPSWIKLLLEKLMVAQLVKKFSAFHRIRKLINISTSLDSVLKQQNSVRNLRPHFVDSQYCIVFHLFLRLSSFLSSGFQTEILYAFFIFPMMQHVQPTHPPWFHDHNNIC